MFGAWIVDVLAEDAKGFNLKIVFLPSFWKV